MAIKVKAVERLLKFNKDDAGEYRYVMQPELYISLKEQKVIREAALRSGVSRGVMQACWDAAGEVIKAWATEGHSVALPGLGTMRFGVRSKSVQNVDDVKTSLITARRKSSRPTMRRSVPTIRGVAARSLPPPPYIRWSSPRTIDNQLNISVQ